MMWAAGMYQLQLVLCRYVFNDRSGGQDTIRIRYKYVSQMCAQKVVGQSSHIPVQCTCTLCTVVWQIEVLRLTSRPGSWPFLHLWGASATELSKLAL